MLEQEETLINDTITRLAQIFPNAHISLGKFLSPHDFTISTDAEFDNDAFVDKIAHTVVDQIVQYILKNGVEYHNIFSGDTTQYEIVFMPKSESKKFADTHHVYTDAAVKYHTYGIYELYTTDDVFNRKSMKFENTSNEGVQYDVSVSLPDAISRSVRWDHERVSLTNATPPQVFPGVSDMFNSQCVFHETPALPVKYFYDIKDKYLDPVNIEEIVDSMIDVFGNHMQYTNGLPHRPLTMVTPSSVRQCCTIGDSVWEIASRHITSPNMLSAFMSTPITLENIQYMYEKNMRMPFDIALCRPHMVSRTAHLVFIRANPLNNVGIDLSNCVIGKNGAQVDVCLDLALDCGYVKNHFLFRDTGRRDSKWIMNDSFRDMLDNKKSSSYVFTMMLPHANHYQGVSSMEMPEYYKTILGIGTQYLHNKKYIWF